MPNHKIETTSPSVLIVDDSATIRAMIKKALTLSVPSITDIHEASNGIEALAFLADNHVDLLLIDINMPRMNGLELARRIRQDENLKYLPIIVISTEGSKARLGELNEFGVSGYLRKPFRPEQLRETLKEIMEIPDDSCSEQSFGNDF